MRGWASHSYQTILVICRQRHASARFTCRDCRESMTRSLEQLRLVSAELINAASKRKRIAVVLKRRGFLPLGKGAWLGFRGTDVVSGLLIEGSPSDTYISSFFLPTFDELRFVSWSLGRRIVHCSPDSSADIECEGAIGAYCSDLLAVRSATEIIEYLDISQRDGFYSLWARYLCYLKNGSLKKAHIYLDDERQSELHSSVLRRLAEIGPSVANGDAAGVAQVLERWEAVSRLIFGNGEFSLDVSI